MNPQFRTKLYNHLIVLLNLLFSVCLTYCSGLVVNNTGIQCAVSERVALLHFKQGISVDNCGLLNSWGDGLDCCQWYGIHCSNRSGHVIGLRLPGTDEDPDDYSYKACLEGTLSESLLELKHLKYLDLRLNKFRGQLPKFIDSLSNLEHLNLSNAGFMGVVPQEIGNLSRLSSLDLNYAYGDSTLRVENLRWLSHLRLLKLLDLSYVDLSVATNTWLSIVNSLPFLQVLRLDQCQLSLESPTSLSYINSSLTLNVISFRFNNLNDTSIFEWLSKFKRLDTSLEYLDLSGNHMFGYNLQVSGRAVQFLGSLCNLKPYTCLLLVSTEEHLSNLSKLTYLGLGYQAELVVNISANWIPPFQLNSLYLRSCKVGPDFPIWLTTQKHLTSISLTNNSISGSIPASFFKSLSAN